MKFRSLLVLLTSLLFSMSLEGQKSNIRKGDEYFKKEHYYEAYQLYKVPETEEDKSALFRRAQSAFHASFLEDAYRDIKKVINRGKYDKEVIYYLAKIQHSLGEYKEAAKNYKEYLRNTSQSDTRRKSVINDIKRCATGMDLKYVSNLGFIENLGEDFNTRFDEINLLQSPNFSNKYYFSSNRNSATGGRRNADGRSDDMGMFYFDMYCAEYKDGLWSDNESINPLLNSSKHEFLQDFSKDGNVMYYSTGRKVDENVILTDTFTSADNESLYSEKLISPILGEYGDKYLSFFNDSTILFSSKREGGFGGYDIYIVAHRNGLWSEPINLGPKVNTPYDEVSPFMAPNGLELYYSSNNTKSIGGHDIFKITYNKILHEWNKSENLGPPINSPDDDIFFKLSRDGVSASFCSDRKTGFGGMDGYVLYLKKVAFNNYLTGELPCLETQEFIVSAIQPRRDRTASMVVQKVSSEETIEEPIEATVVPQEKEIVISKLKISPLFYGEDENIVQGENKEKVDNLIQFMKKFPQLKLEIVCNTLKEGITAYDLYFSIKRVEKIGEYIIENGIDPQRLLLKGTGSNYPIARFSSDGRSSAMADQMNRRVDIFIHNYEDLPLEVEIEEPFVVEYLRDNSNGIYRTIVEGLSYKVQIAAVNRMYQNELLKYYTDSMIEKNMNNGRYLYTIGLYDDYFSAKELYKDLKQNDVSGILIIPYKNGVRIGRNKIIDHAREFPDLVNYLQYND